MNDAATSCLRKARLAALVAAVVGGALCIVGLVINRHLFVESYLVAAIFWLGASLGCAAMAMTYHLTGGRWGDAVLGIFESGMAVLPLMALLFIPVLLGIGSLYVWSHADAVRADPLLQHKQAYLNAGFFVARTVIYFLAWLISAFLLLRWSDARRRTGDGNYSRLLERVSAIGLVVYVVTMTLAGFDWMMSLEPHWYSTVYGFIIIAGQGLLGIAICTITYVLLSGAPGSGTSRGGSGDPPYVPGASAGTPPSRGVLYDLGNLLLMGVAFWSYVQFSQFLIIYYGNVPEETAWYLPRTHGGWGHVGASLIALHFGLPLALLLSRWLKQQARALMCIATGLVVIQLVAEMWMILPAFGIDQRRWWPIGLDLAAVMGVGGLWVLMFTTQLMRRPMWAVSYPPVAPPLSPAYLTSPAHAPGRRSPRHAH